MKNVIDFVCLESVRLKTAIKKTFENVNGGSMDHGSISAEVTNFDERTKLIWFDKFEMFLFWLKGKKKKIWKLLSYKQIDY